MAIGDKYLATQKYVDLRKLYNHAIMTVACLEVDKIERQLREQGEPFSTEDLTFEFGILAEVDVPEVGEVMATVEEDDFGNEVIGDQMVKLGFATKVPAP